MITLYQQASTGKIKQWSMERKGFVLTTTWGLQGGAMQNTREVVDGKNIGKANEICPEDQAKLVMERRVKKKVDNGYVTNIDQLGQSSPFKLSNLTSSFAPAKPITSIDADEVRKLHAEDKVMIQRKYDGQRHFIVKDENGKVTVWSRKMKDMTALVPHIVDLMNYVPNGTLFDAELILDSEEHDRFKEVSSILRSKPDKAMERQKEYGYLHAVVFDILFVDGEPVWKQNYEERYSLFCENVPCGKDPNGEHVFSWPTNLLSQHRLEDLLSWKVGEAWEGFCVWRLDQPTELRFDGKPKRCNAYKYKRIYTEDVIVREPYVGKTGRNKARFGGFSMYQMHDGQEIHVGECGGGFSDEDRDTFMDLDYPLVAEIEYTERLESMKLRYPQFVRFHPDKTPDECQVQFMPRSS